MSKSYSEKLKDPRWQKKRLEVLSRDEFTCQCCGATDKTLHVHHKFYFSDTEPWEDFRNQLITLCEDCHSTEHIENLDNEYAITAGMYSIGAKTSSDLRRIGYLLLIAKTDFDEVVGFIESKTPKKNG